MPKPTEDQIRTEYYKAADYMVDGRPVYPGMSYLQGIDDALAWVLGDNENAPLSELPDKNDEDKDEE